jgi:hypothetical protein
MPNPDLRRPRVPVELGKFSLEIHEPVGRPRDLNGPRAQKSDSGAVVPSVFELPETAQQNRRRLLATNVPKYPAHLFFISPKEISPRASREDVNEQAVCRSRGGKTGQTCFVYFWRIPSVAGNVPRQRAYWALGCQTLEIMGKEGDRAVPRALVKLDPSGVLGAGTFPRRLS